MAAGAEKTFENKVKKYLEQQGAWLLKYWAGGGMTKSGIPDLLVCYKGCFLGLEIKSETGKPSELQKYNIDALRKAGGIACVLRPQTWESFKVMLDKMDFKYDGFEIREDI